MPIKKIRVSFDLDMDIFMKMLHHGNTAVKIDFFADNPGARAPGGTKVAQERHARLPAPLRAANTPPVRIFVLAFLVEHKDTPVTTKEISSHVSSKGYAPTSTYAALHTLVATKLVRKTGLGLYQITTAGITANGQ